MAGLDFLGDIGLGFGGTAFSAKLSADEALKQRKFQREVYRSRYQWTMEDMRKAGLNPMLAYKTGVGQPGSGAMGSVPDAAAGIAGQRSASAASSQASSAKALRRQQMAGVQASIREADSRVLLNDATAKKVAEDTRIAQERWKLEKLKGEVGEIGLSAVETARDAPMNLYHSAKELRKLESEKVDLDEAIRRNDARLKARGSKLEESQYRRGLRKRKKRSWWQRYGWR